MQVKIFPGLLYSADSKLVTAHLMMPTHTAGGTMAIESAAVLKILMDVKSRASGTEMHRNDTNTAESPLRSTSYLVSRSLKEFDSLRVPRCTAFQILSNGGFLSQARPEIVEEIRRHGFNGSLPGPNAGPYSKEYRDWYFDYDARVAARTSSNELSNGFR